MKFKRPTSSVSDPDMTPMIDIVFQLIAFFMIVTNFEQTLADERVVLPADDLARPPLAPREQEVVVNIGFIRNPDGTKKDPDPYVFHPGGEQIPVLNYGPKLKLEADVSKSRGISPSEITIVIRADADTPTGLVQELIKIGQENGFSKFAMKAQVGEDPEQ